MLSDRGLWVLGLASAAAALHHHPVRQLTAVTDYLGGDYACDVEHGICAPLTVIFARDTYEEGNIGTFLGPYLFDELSTALHGHVALQGLNYEADWTGDVQQGGEGSPALVQLVGQAIHNCPSTKIVLVGYGQGATTIHYALNVGGLASSDVALVLYFGDPGKSSRFLLYISDVFKDTASLLAAPCLLRRSSSIAMPEMDSASCTPS